MARRDSVTGTPLALLSAAVRYCFQDDTVKLIPDADFGGTIATGSSPSHLDLPEVYNMTSKTRHSLADADIMFLGYPKDFLVETQRIHPSLNPGFCYLRLKDFHNGVPYIKDLEGQYIHNEYFREHSERMIKYFHHKKTVHAMEPREIGLKFVEKKYKIEADFVFCISIRWPGEATEWTTRKRKSGWPSKDLVHDCVTPGCHVVKKAHPLSTRPSIEWRFSFSAAEKKLGQRLTYSQRVCYKVFKALIKPDNTGNTEGIVSYYLLTTLFWVCEEVPTSHWNTSSLGNMLLCLLDKLLHFLSRRYLPNYFIPQANLLDNATETNIQRWQNGILSIRMNPIAKLINFHSKFFVIQGSLICKNMVTGLKELTKQEQSLKNRLHSFLKTIALKCACDNRHDMVISLAKMICSLGFQTEADLYVSDTMDIDKDSELPILIDMYDMLSDEVAADRICILSDPFPRHLMVRRRWIVVAILLAEEASLTYQYSTSAKLSASEKQECLEQTQQLFQIALEDPPVHVEVQYSQFLMTQDRHEEALDILKEIVRSGGRLGEPPTKIYFSRFTTACMDDILRADMDVKEIVGYLAYPLAYYLLLRCYTKLKRHFTAEDVPPVSHYRKSLVNAQRPEWKTGLLHLEGCFCLSKGHVYHALHVFLSNYNYYDSYPRVWYCVARLYLDLLPQVEHDLAQH